MLGTEYFLCEACKHFDTDGTDGNHPNCSRQKTGLHDRAIPLGQECPFGYEFGVPCGYPVSMERNTKRAYEVKAILDDLYEPKKDPLTEILDDLYEVRKELEASYPPSRERSLALTKLDEAAMWIKATPLETHESEPNV